MKPDTFLNKTIPLLSPKWKKKKTSLNKLCNFLECEEVFLYRGVNFTSPLYNSFITPFALSPQENLNPSIKTKSIKQHQKKKHHENTKQKVCQLKIKF